MEIITADFETYYDKDYSLSKLTTEEYIRDPRFEVIMLGLRMSNGERRVITGTHQQIAYEVDQIEWGKYAVLAHNCIFDATILAWRFGVTPAAWLDTLSMARAYHGAKGNSLAALAKKYQLQDKGDEVVNMIGRRRESLSKAEFDKYAEYCLGDVEICFQLFTMMNAGWYDLPSVDFRGAFPQQELRLIDLLIRMFTEPMLRLNKEKLETHLVGIVERKEKLLSDGGVAKADLMSNPKFAEILRGFGVDPPMKISPTTGKLTFAFAKSDPGMKAMLEHPDERVQAVVTARMGVKSTLEETRTKRFIGIAERDPTFPVPIKYSAAKTHRLGGMDKVNLQNLTSRGVGAGGLKACIEAPPGYVLINSDSSQIEARVLAWLAEQDDLVEDFRNAVDVYCKMASTIYGREVTKADEQLRFNGKTVILGAGYQTGPKKLQATLKAATPPQDISDDEAARIINTYRGTYPRIPKLWKQGDEAIKALHHGKTMWYGREGIVLVDGERGVKLPNGLYIQYPQLHWDKNEAKWKYKDVDGLVDLYGGKFTENVVQALARIIVMQQTLKIARKLTVTLPVHDAIVAIAREEEAKEARQFVEEECMSWTPKWAAGCPIACESKVGYNYGDMKKEWK